MEEKELLNEQDGVYYQGYMDIKTFQYLRIVFITIISVLALAFLGFSIWFAILTANGTAKLLFWVILLGVLLVLSIAMLVYYIKNKNGYMKYKFSLELQGISFTTGLIFPKRYFIKYEEITDVNYGKGTLYNDMRAGNIYISTNSKVYVIANVERPQEVFGLIMECLNAYYTVLNEENSEELAEEQSQEDLTEQEQGENQEEPSQETSDEPEEQKENAQTDDEQKQGSNKDE